MAAFENDEPQRGLVPFAWEWSRLDPGLEKGEQP
jgi:hypothetical protein